MSEHRWSGWPGAWCLDCGVEDMTELALADGALIPMPPQSDDPQDTGSLTWRSPEDQAAYSHRPCSEPGSKRHDPYAKLETKS